MSGQLNLFQGASEVASQAGKRRRQSSPSSPNLLDADLVQQVATLSERVEQLDRSISELTRLLTVQKTVKEAYTTKEAAELLGRRPYTIREWCRLKRINAFKAPCGRGAEDEWRISHEELTRFQNEGLLPIPDKY